MDRPRTIVLERDDDVLAVLRYIELNPVRAGLARRPRDYRWSSYRHHALGRSDNIVNDCPSVSALGTTTKERRAAYVASFGIVYAALDQRRRSDLVDTYFVGSLRWCARRCEALREMKKVRWRPPS